MLHPLGWIRAESLLETASWLVMRILHQLAHFDLRTWVLLLALLVVLLGWSSARWPLGTSRRHRRSADVITWQGRGGD